MSDDSTVTERRSYANSNYFESIGLVDQNNKVVPGQEFTPLTDDELLYLLGIDEDGNLRPDVIATALQDVKVNDPFIYALMTAESNG